MIFERVVNTRKYKVKGYTYYRVILNIPAKLGRLGKVRVIVLPPEEEILSKILEKLEKIEDDINVLKQRSIKVMTVTAVKTEEPNQVEELEETENLPQFMKGNPWLTVLRKRGKE
ncbi:hypothetical protein DRJ16_02380 [Candidatus Woesearchaeota archaeon]|nr:MAG: hypothetical protein DRJ16_02380 [Candidatus Woesearchaeota archaeon]